jgi:hypothetical protein
MKIVIDGHEHAVHPDPNGHMTGKALHALGGKGELYSSDGKTIANDTALWPVAEGTTFSTAVPRKQAGGAAAE